MSGEVEDEKHFVLDCFVYEDLRKTMFDVVKTVMLKREEIEDVMKSETGRQRIFGALLRGGVEDREARAVLRNVALEFGKAAMKRRKHIVVTYLDQKT